MILPVMLAATLGITGCDQTGKKADAKQADTTAYNASVTPDAVSAESSICIRRHTKSS